MPTPWASITSFQTGYVNKISLIVCYSKFAKPFFITCFCFVFLCVDLQIKCEDQGDLGVAGARFIPLRATVCSESWGGRWRWWYVSTNGNTIYLILQQHLWYKLFHDDPVLCPQECCWPLWQLPAPRDQHTCSFSMPRICPRLPEQKWSATFLSPFMACINPNDALRRISGYQ